MKKIFLILVIICCCVLCGCSVNTKKTTVDNIKEKDILTVGVKFDSKPFGFVQNGEIKGYDIDIAKAIAKNILDDENKIKFVEVTSDNRISKLVSEEVDLIVATMTDTQERRQIVDFSEPYYISGQAVLCKKNSKVSSVADLTHHNAVIVRGTTAEKTLLQYYRKSNIIKAKTYKEGFNYINDDTCMMADEAILQGFVMDNSGYEIFNKRLTTEPYAVAIRKDDETLKNYVNSTIKNLTDSGELEKIKNKWIK